MDPLIEKLRSTTFFGKRFTRRQLADIQATVGTFPDLSRTELGQTICEHLLYWRGAGEKGMVATTPDPLSPVPQVA